MWRQWEEAQGGGNGVEAMCGRAQLRRAGRTVGDRSRVEIEICEIGERREEGNLVVGDRHVEEVERYELCGEERGVRREG